MLLCCLQNNNLIPDILKYINISPDRDASEHLVTLGIITSDQYNQHWFKCCEAKYKKPGSFHFPFDSNVDYGWLFCILSRVKGQNPQIDLSKYTHEQKNLIRQNIAITHGKCDDWYINIARNYPYHTTVVRECQYCDLHPYSLIPQSCITKKFNISYEHATRCSSNHQTALLLIHFFKLFNEIYPETVKATINYINMYLPECLAGCIRRGNPLIKCVANQILDYEKMICLNKSAQTKLSDYINKFHFK